MAQGFGKKSQKKGRQTSRVKHSNSIARDNKLQLAIQHYHSGQLQQAEVCCQQVLQEQPKNAEAWYLLGTIATQQGQGETAIKQIERAIELKPDSAEAYFSLGNLYRQQGDLLQAIAAYQHLLQLKPDYVIAYSNLGVFYIEHGQPQEAIKCFEQAIDLNPDHVDAYYNLGTLYREKGQLDEAIKCFQRGIELQPNFSENYYSLGFIYATQCQFAEALQAFQKTLQLQPNHVSALYNLGCVYKELNQLPEAIAYFKQVIQLNPAYAQAYNNLGCLYQQQWQFDEAVNFFLKAIELDPDYAPAYSNLGKICREQKQFNEAIKYLKRAIQLKPDTAEAHYNLGYVYQSTSHLSQAIPYYQKALDLKPNFVEVYNNLGTLYKDRSALSECFKYYEKALEIKPDDAPANHNLIFCLHYSSDYSPSQIYAEHQKWSERMALPTAETIQPHSNDKNPEKRLRIGYVSGDFKTHSVTFFFAPLLASHNRRNFEIFCYANNHKTDATTEKLRQMSDTWREIYTLNDEQLVELIHQDRIDILVDLSGHTAGNRLLVFAHKPAPVQVSYIGYPDTTGLNTIDYRLVDAWTDPEGQSEHLHTEALIRLPHGFLCYQPPSDCPPVSPPPVLEKGEITFGSWNSLAKVSNKLVIYWSKILKAVPNSRLLLKSSPLSDPDTCNYVKGRFKEQGIEENRLELIGWIPNQNQHLALYSQVDIALDTFPYNGTTTTCEALWMGVPVITLAGLAHVSRVGVSLLHSVGLEELIAESADDYIQKAIELANNRERLQQLRTTLRSQMQAAPLTNGKLIAQSVEDAYRTMWRKWCGSQEAAVSPVVKEKPELVSPPVVREKPAAKADLVKVKGKKIISFSLWGDNPKYTVGAIKNAELAPIIYPDWNCRFYIAQTVPQAIADKLLELNHVEVVRLNSKQDWEASLWRFYPADETDVAVMISRDTDSRLNWRERAAVDAWMTSDKLFHIMRDHPLHHSPIMAGMWGVKAGLFKDIKGMIKAYLALVNQSHINYGIDQQFLANIIYPLVQDRSLVHDEIFAGKPFPTERYSCQFVGQAFTADDSSYRGNIAQLKRYLLLRAQGQAEATVAYSPQTIETALARPIKESPQISKQQVSEKENPLPITYYLLPK